MKQAVRVLSTYSADLFGINSVLYELGGMVVMHDASGCNSTYNTHDEPRWYTMDSMIYISHMMENDVILGNDEKLITDICDAAMEKKPRFIVVTAGLIPLFLSTDMKGIARIIQQRTGIPSFGFTTNAMDTYVLGACAAQEMLVKNFCHDPSGSDKKEGKMAPGKIKINLLGVNPLDFSVTGNVEALTRLFEEAGFQIICTMAMGSTLDHIGRMGEADVNVALSSTARDASVYMKKKFGIPYVTGVPMGKYASEKMISLIREAAADGRCRSIFDVPDPSAKTAQTHIREDFSYADNEYKSRRDPHNIKQCATGGAFVIGEALAAASVRTCLEHDFGMKNVHLICTTEFTCGLLRDGDLHSREEEDLEKALAGASTVVGDPIFSRILPGNRKPRSWSNSPVFIKARDVKDQNMDTLKIASEKDESFRFVNLPHEAYSGRMYRSSIPVFIGPEFTGWMKEQLETQHIIYSNDIEQANHPFIDVPKY